MDYETEASATSSAVCGGACDTDGDLTLLALERQFKALTAELAALQCVNEAQDGGASSAETLRPRIQEQSDQDATRQAEAILARLYPVEQAIMTTPAHSISGLGVKARHAAYVMSQYWTAPIAEIDWHARVIRLLIESVCSRANVPLPICGRDEPTESAREIPVHPSLLREDARDRSPTQS